MDYAEHTEGRAYTRKDWMSVRSTVFVLKRGPTAITKRRKVIQGRSDQAGPFWKKEGKWGTKKSRLSNLLHDQKNKEAEGKFRKRNEREKVEKGVRPKNTSSGQC